jgi:hypothetical protein
MLLICRGLVSFISSQKSEEKEGKVNDTPTILRLPGLTPLERIELEDCLDANLLEFED